jgi:hypothetical protein
MVSPLGPAHWKLTPKRNPPVARELSFRKSLREGTKTSLLSSAFLFFKNGKFGIIDFDVLGSG